MYETEYLLTLASEIGFLSEDAQKKFNEVVAEVASLLNGLIRKKRRSA